MDKPVTLVLRGLCGSDAAAWHSFSRSRKKHERDAFPTLEVPSCLPHTWFAVVAKVPRVSRKADIRFFGSVAWRRPWGSATLKRSATSCGCIPFWWRDSEIFRLLASFRRFLDAEKTVFIRGRVQICLSCFRVAKGARLYGNGA